MHCLYTDKCQKLFNAIKENSYIRPHRHSLDPKEECLIAIKGLFELIIFTDQGIIESITFLWSEKYSEKLSIASGLELPAWVWHTVISLEDDSALFEIKGGPFNPSLAKEFAPWAPEEGTQHTNVFLKRLSERLYPQ